MSPELKIILKKEIIKEITEKYSEEFNLREGGLYLIEIIASAKSWWQNFKSGRIFSKDDDITLKLDRFELTTSKSRKGDVRPAWNGNEIKGFNKTVLVAIKLIAGKHNIEFKPNYSPFLKSIAVSQVLAKDKITYIPTDNNPAQNGGPRSWLSYILINQFISGIIISATAGKKGRDDDDIKLLINGDVQRNNDNPHKDWYWCGKALKGRENEFIKEIKKKEGQFNIDLLSDESPFLHKILVQLRQDDNGEEDRLSSQYIIKQILDLYNEKNTEIIFEKIPSINLKNSDKYDDIIKKASNEFKMDQILLKATIAQESKFGLYVDHDNRYEGESGLMGLEKNNSIETLKQQGHKFDYSKIEDVIRASAAYYKWIKSYKSKNLSIFKDPNSPLKLYTQYRIDLNARKITTPGIKEFLYYYFYYKNQ